jgi:lipopolysaccharide transport system permease protein
LLVLFSFVFGTVLKLSPLGARTESFGVFLFCGLLPWTAFQEGVMRSATAVTEHANLVKKLNFPSELLSLAAVLGALVQEAAATLLFLAVLAYLGELSVPSLAWLLLAVPIQVAFTAGLGLTLGALQVFFRDIAQFLGMVLTGWFYFTPIVYPLAQVPEPYRGWIELNPMTALVELYRAAFLGGSPGPLEDLLRLAVIAGLVLLLGLWLFRRLKPTFADEI